MKKKYEEAYKKVSELKICFSETRKFAQIYDILVCDIDIKITDIVSGSFNFKKVSFNFYGTNDFFLLGSSDIDISLLSILEKLTKK